MIDIYTQRRKRAQLLSRICDRVIINHFLWVSLEGLSYTSTENSNCSIDNVARWFIQYQWNTWIILWKWYTIVQATFTIGDWWLIYLKMFHTLLLGAFKRVYSKEWTYTRIHSIWIDPTTTKFSPSPVIVERNKAVQIISPSIRLGAHIKLYVNDPSPLLKTTSKYFTLLVNHLEVSSFQIEWTSWINFCDYSYIIKRNLQQED